MRYLLTLLLCGSLSAASTYYVAPGGTDSPSAGTELNPWQTISYAATIVSAGDTVNIAAGTYTNFVNWTTPGTSGSRITWVGERDGDDWLTILDSSVEIPSTGWTAATGDFTGGNLAYKRSMDFAPCLVTLDDESILEMRWSANAESAGWWNLSKLGRATDYVYSSGIGNKYWWDGYESMWTWYNDTLYIRFRDGSSPATKSLKASPRANTMTRLTGASYNTFQDLHIRGGRLAMEWIEDVEGVIVERCLLDQGLRLINATGNTRNCIIRSNVLRGAHSTSRPYGPRGAAIPESNAEYQLYLKNKYEWGWSLERGAIHLWDPGVNNLIHDNTITNICVGVMIDQGDNRPQLARDASGTTLLRNTFRHGVHPIFIGAGHGAITVASNSLAFVHYGVRLQNMQVVPANDDPYLVYGNTFANTNLVGDGFYAHAWGASLSLIGSPSTTPANRQEVWLYHNTFSGLSRGALFSDVFSVSTDGGLPRLYILNNLMSVGTALRGEGYLTPVFRTDYLGALDYNSWLLQSGDSTTIAEAGANNVVMPDYEWPITAEPDFEIAADSSARAAGIDISDTFTVNDVEHSALPGFSPGYYESDIGPDIGAVQYSPGAEVPLVSVTATDSLAHESTLDTGTFTLTRTESLTGTLTVDYAITGTATAGTDYADDLGTSITFADGEGSTNLVVTPLDNGEYLGNRTVTLTLAEDAAYLLRQPTSATITIVEGDQQPGSLTRPPAPGHTPATRTIRL